MFTAMGKCCQLGMSRPSMAVLCHPAAGCEGGSCSRGAGSVLLCIRAMPSWPQMALTSSKTQTASAFYFTVVYVQGCQLRTSGPTQGNPQSCRSRSREQSMQLRSGQPSALHQYQGLPRWLKRLQMLLWRSSRFWQMWAPGQKLPLTKVHHPNPH